MPQINPTIPTIGEGVASSDPKIVNAFTELVNLVNGDLDADNLATGAVTAPKLAAQPSVILRRTVMQSIPYGALTAIVFDTANATEERDNANMHDLVTNPSRITATVAGLYLVTTTLELNAHSPGAADIWLDESFILIKNGVTRYGTKYLTRTPQPTTATIRARGDEFTALIPLGVGDYVESYYYHVNSNPGGAVASQVSAAILSAVRIGA